MSESAEGLPVRCAACGHHAVVRSRSLLGIIVELHGEICGAGALEVVGGVEDMLALPPYDEDLTPLISRAPVPPQKGPLSGRDLLLNM